MAIPQIDRETGRHTYTSMPEFLVYQKDASDFQSVAAYQRAVFSLSSNGHPERINGALASQNLFSTLGVSPILGRLFNTTDPDGSVIISDSLWSHRFHKDPTILGRVILLDGHPGIIVGVMAAGFWFPTAQSQVWRLVTTDYYGLKESDNFHFLYVFGRLKPAATVEHAQAQLAVSYRRLALQDPALNSNRSVAVTSLSAELLGNGKPLLLAAMGAVVCVLLIACANIANLQFSRYVYRQSELAIRLALGATWTQVVRLLLLDNMLLSLTGGTCGLSLALLSLRFAVPHDLFMVPVSSRAMIDPAAVTFTMFLCISTGVLFSVAPALQLLSPMVMSHLGERGRGQSFGKRARYFQACLVIAEISSSLILLIGLMLMAQSFRRLSSVDLGYDPESLVMMIVKLPDVGYHDQISIRSFEKRVEDRILAIPGVKNVAASSDTPLVSGFENFFMVNGLAEGVKANKPLVAQASISPGYFATMGIPLRKGREFSSSDRRGGQLVAVVSASMARRFWAGGDPIGSQIRHGLADEPTSWYRVIGVASDVRPFIERDPEPKIYTPFLQVPEGYENVLGKPLTFVVRTAGRDLNVTSSLRAVISDTDPELACEIRSMNAILTESLALPKYRMLLFGILGIVALWLSVIGVYAVTCGMTLSETRSLGIRLALGAPRSSILSLVLRRGMLITSIGIALGLLMSIFATRILQGLLFEVHPISIGAYLAAAIVLMASSLIAIYIPGRRASRINPIIALRVE